jgi:hypothetical protein
MDSDVQAYGGKGDCDAGDGNPAHFRGNAELPGRSVGGIAGIDKARLGAGGADLSGTRSSRSRGG